MKFVAEPPNNPVVAWLKRRLPRWLLASIFIGCLPIAVVTVMIGRATEDQRALPQLVSPHWAPKTGCPAQVLVGDLIGRDCLAFREQIQSSFTMRRFGLPLLSGRKGEEGWFRVGADAVEVHNDVGGSRVTKVVKAVFGRGRMPG